MRQLLIVLFVLLIVGNKAQGPILTYKYLQEGGYNDLIYQAKCGIGDDIAIDICRALVDSPYCEEVVRVYMDSCINDQKYIDVKDFIYKEENMNILLKSLSQNEIERLVKKLENESKIKKENI